MFDSFFSNHLSVVSVDRLESAINKKLCNTCSAMREDALYSHCKAEDAQSVLHT